VSWRSPSRLRDDPDRYPPLAEVYSGRRQVSSKATMGLAANILI
jgi:hypothetical protein